MLTAGVSALPELQRSRVLKAVQSCEDSAFDKANDPYGEHDFIAFDIEGQPYFVKIDYYDVDMKFGSEDPADPEKTVRVLTIMRADEY